MVFYQNYFYVTITFIAVLGLFLILYPFLDLFLIGFCHNKRVFKRAAYWIAWWDCQRLHKKPELDRKAYQNYVFDRLCELCITNASDGRPLPSEGFTNYVSLVSCSPLLILQIIGYWYYSFDKYFVKLHKYRPICEADGSELDCLIRTLFPNVYRYELLRRDASRNCLVLNVVVSYDTIADMTYVRDEVVLYDFDSISDLRFVQTVLSVGHENLENYKQLLLSYGFFKYLDQNPYLF